MLNILYLPKIKKKLFISRKLFIIYLIFFFLNNNYFNFLVFDIESLIFTKRFVLIGVVFYLFYSKEFHFFYLNFNFFEDIFQFSNFICKLKNILIFSGKFGFFLN